MNKILALVSALVFFGVSAASAQTPPPVTVDQNCKFTWDVYTDTNAASLKLYITKDGVSLPAKTGIPVTSTTITCANAGVTANGLYRANLHAVNAQGLESDPSNGIVFTFRVNIKPLAPANLQVAP